MTTDRWPRANCAAALSAFLVEVRAGSQTASRARLIFGLDATASRKDLGYGGRAPAEMFRTAAAVGSLDLQAGLLPRRWRVQSHELDLRSSPSRPDHVHDRLSGRQTQIEKILTHARKRRRSCTSRPRCSSATPVRRERDRLVARARELGRFRCPGFHVPGRTTPISAGLSRHRWKHGGRVWAVRFGRGQATGRAAQGGGGVRDRRSEGARRAEGRRERAVARTAQGRRLSTEGR